MYGIQSTHSPSLTVWTAFTDATYRINDTTTGFMARVYTRGSEVVISYCGTTDENLLDWTQGNLPAGTGLRAPQVLQAAELYMKAASDPQFAGKSISFTGHSLGGGLASLMAVWFDRPATVFDEAFFSKSADSMVITNWLRSELTAKGYTLPSALLTCQTDTSLISQATNNWDPSPTRLLRQAQVRNTFIKGEVLSVISSGILNNLGYIYGDGKAQQPDGTRYGNYTPAEQHGSDVIDGGAGNDTLVGGADLGFAIVGVRLSAQPCANDERMLHAA